MLCAVLSLFKPQFILILLGRFTYYFLEEAVKVGQIFKAARIRDLSDGPVFFGQPFTGMPDTDLIQELHERFFGAVLKEAAERLWGEIGDAGYVVQGYLLGEVVHHIFEHLVYLMVVFYIKGMGIARAGQEVAVFGLRQRFQDVQQRNDAFQPFLFGECQYLIL